MKIGCECGNVIVDQTDFLPYKGCLTATNTFVITVILNRRILMWNNIGNFPDNCVR